MQNYEVLSIRARNLKLKMLFAKIALLICYLEINIIVQEGSEIQATGTVEFEDGLRTGVLQEDSWCPYSGCATLESDMARS